MSSGIRLKKGFTLIELLAVIVIIGVIALITYPAVNRAITNSRMTALKNSAESLLRETNLQTAMNKIGEDSQVLITDERLNLKNNQFTSGFIFKNGDGKLELKNVTNGSFCINGTSGHLTIEKGNCNYSDKTGPTLVLQTGYIGATEAMVLAKGEDKDSGIRGYEYKIGNGDYTEMQDDNFYQFEGLKRNTSYKVTVRVTNGVGLTTEKSITFKTKNISAATFVVSDASKWTTKKDVTINYPTRVNGVTYRYKIGNGSWQVLTSGKKKELEVKENTVIYAEVILNGETVSSNVSVTKIDNTPPVITSIKPDTTSWKRQVTIQVIATDTPSGIAGYSFNDGATWTSASTYTTTKNGTYKIKVKDYANNITSGQITINNIDRTGPKCVSSGGNNTWTNQSRTIIGTCIDDGEGAGCEARTVSKTISTDTNAKMSPGVVKDVAGNETTCPATEMVKVDKTKPSCKVTLSTADWTNKAVTAYGKCKDSLSGCATNDVKKKYSSEMNAKVTIGTVKDKAGNETNCTSSQNVKIDLTKPSCTVSGGSTTWTSGSRTVTGKCSDTGGSGCKSDISYTYKGTAGKNYSITNAGPDGAGKGGKVYDKAGNSASCAANQTVKIDRKKPSCSVSGGSSTWTNSSRTVTGKCSDDGSGCKGNISYTYNGTANQNYSITNAGAAGAGKGGTVYDNVGNSASCAANQTVKIDRKKPSCTVSGGSTTWTSGSRTVTGKCSDTGGSGCKGNISYTYNGIANQNYSITNAGAAGAGKGGTVSDNAGNSTTCSANQTVKIDRKKPSCTVSGGSTTWTSGSRTVTGKCSDDGSGCKGNISHTYNGTANQNYNITNAGAAGAGNGGTVSDNVGNTTSCAANQTVRIDKKAPTCTSSGGSSGWVFGGSITLTGTCNDSGGSGCKGNASKTYYPETDITNGSPGTVYDNVGHSTACPANQGVHITEKLEAPIITNPTNGNWVNHDFSLNVKTPNNKITVAYWQYRYASISWQTYSNSATNNFTTTPYSAERNEATYIRYCLSNGKCSPEASTMIRIDKTNPGWDVSMHPGGYRFADGSYQNFTCYAKIDYYDYASGLSAVYDLVGNSGAIMRPYGNLWGASTTKGTDTDVMGSFGAYYAFYGFRLCDVAGNCKSQPRVAGYC